MFAKTLEACKTMLYYGIAGIDLSVSMLNGTKIAESELSTKVPNPIYAQS